FTHPGTRITPHPVRRATEHREEEQNVRRRGPQARDHLPLLQIPRALHGLHPAAPKIQAAPAPFRARCTSDAAGPPLRPLRLWVLWNNTHLPHSSCQPSLPLHSLAGGTTTNCPPCPNALPCTTLPDTRCAHAPPRTDAPEPHPCRWAAADAVLPSVVLRFLLQRFLYRSHEHPYPARRIRRSRSGVGWAGIRAESPERVRCEVLGRFYNPLLGAVPSIHCHSFVPFSFPIPESSFLRSFIRQ
ncbi:hypothetical protein C8R43DRAFT_1199969, partial [Mycena crocata]